MRHDVLSFSNISVLYHLIVRVFIFQIHDFINFNEIKTTFIGDTTT